MADGEMVVLQGIPLPQSEHQHYSVPVGKVEDLGRERAEEGREESPLRKIIDVSLIVATCGLLVAGVVGRAWDFKWWVGVATFPALVWIPVFLSLHNGRRIDELLLASSAPWDSVIRPSSNAHALNNVDPNSEQAIKTLEGGRSVVLFGGLALGALTVGSAWIEDGATCCTTVWAVKCIDGGFMFGTIFMLLIYAGMTITIRKRRLLQANPGAIVTKGENASSSASSKKRKPGPGFVLNTLLAGNILVILTSAHCKEQLKHTALYFAPVLGVLWIVIRGRPCHLAGLAIAMSFVFTPACLFRLEVDPWTALVDVAWTALGYAVSLCGYVVWARRKYKEAAAERAQASQSSLLKSPSSSSSTSSSSSSLSSSGHSVGVDVAESAVRRRRHNDDLSPQQSSRKQHWRKASRSFMWKSRWHLFVIFLGLAIVCFPDSPQHIREAVARGQLTTAGAEGIMRNSLTKLREQMSAALRRANTDLHSQLDSSHLVGCSSHRAGDVGVVVVLALLLPAVELLLSCYCCCHQVVAAAAAWFAPAAFVPAGNRHTCSIVLLLGSACVAALTVSRDKAAYHLTTSEHLVVLAPPLCGGLLGLVGLAAHHTRAARHAFARRHGIRPGSWFRSCFGCCGCSAEPRESSGRGTGGSEGAAGRGRGGRSAPGCRMVSPLALYIYPLAQAAKAVGGCAAFGEPFLADEVFVLADHHGYLMVLVLTLIVTLAVHSLMHAPPWRILAQVISSWLYFKVSVAFHLDDVKDTGAFSHLVFVFHVFCAVVALLLCRNAPSSEKQKDEQELASELSSWAA